jgi:hypothetical protein
LERGEYLLDYQRCGSDIYCFKEERDTIKSNSRLACRVLMMAYKADWAVVVNGGVMMVMKSRHECGQQENQYE